jgi:predicted TIM-barrel fold metal-dependent hydrolase
VTDAPDPAPDPAAAAGAADAAVPGFWRRLGLPGLVDAHVHFLPPRVLAAVWRYFAAAEEHYGRAWPIAYQLGDDERIALLRSFGVRAFTGLAYPHKAGMAPFLNDWTLDLAEKTPDLVPSATFFPEPDAGEYVRAALDRGARVFKAHLQVGRYDPNDPLLDPVWGALAEAGTPAVVHCGNGPRPGPHTGVAPMERVLRRHPGLVLVVAHAGMPDYLGFAALADRHPRVHLDTTMLGTAFTEEMAPMPPELGARLADLGDRVVLGTDFPNIPYPYLTQLDALAGLGLGDDWLRAVCWSNGVRLLGLGPDGTVGAAG